jgi:ubiquinol-cytochrome c reductase cytochrome c subunit
MGHDRSRREQVSAGQRHQNESAQRRTAGISRRQAAVLLIVAVTLAGALTIWRSASAHGQSPSPSAAPILSSSPAPISSVTAPSPGAASPSPAAAPAGSGAAIFAQNCSACHGPRGQGLICPSLTAAGFPDLVADMVRRGGRLGPGLVMPPLQKTLSGAEISAVATYVSQELADPASRSANVADGGAIFRLYCSGCHGAIGRGGALARGKNAVTYAGRPAASALAAMIVGPLNMPVFTSTLSITQQAAVARYVQVLITPPSPGGNGLGFRGPVAEGFAMMLGLLALIVAAITLAWGKKGVPRD